MENKLDAELLLSGLKYCVTMESLSSVPELAPTTAVAAADA